MHTRVRLHLWLLLLIALFCAQAHGQTLSNGAGAFATGHYRNLFAEAGHSDKEIHAKIDAAYAQLFHGDPQTQAVYFPAGKTPTAPSPISPTGPTTTPAPRACHTA